MMKKKLIILFITITIICIAFLLVNSTKKTYAIGTTLADTVMALNKGSSWSSGASGVYYTNNHEYRYIGAEPNNYVSFNNDLYRIIGVFDDNSHGVTGEYLVKLIRARGLGSYNWGTYNTTNTSGEMSSYANDWTGNTTGVKANLNVLLNEYFYRKVSTSNDYGTCSTWTHYYLHSPYTTNDCTMLVGYGIDNSLQNFIEEVTWYLTGYDYVRHSKEEFYLCERGQSTDTTNCSSGNSGAYDASTTAHIGLMYVSDYMYASSYFSNSNTTDGTSKYYGNKNWLFKGSEWTITPQSNGYNIFDIWLNGSLSTSYSYNGNFFRPSFYLKSSVYVTGGNGSFSNPYTIACDDCDVEEPEHTPETTLTKLGLTVSSGTPNFANTSCSSGCNETTIGVYSAEDDLGTSYYFRGDVTNNYVKFAGFYWRIIRINGDGSIRMIYDGTSAHANGESSTDRQIGTSAFNSTYNDNTYVGYMTGTAGASTYALAHSNSTDSTIKVVIDNWYKTNIVDTGYSGSVVDAIYCNDRSIDPTSSGTGIGTSATEYGADYRLYDNKMPTLKCAQVSDRFTTEATVGNVTGNDKLTYPVGLITADEVSMAGGVNSKSNSSYYLYTNNTIWTMSPFYFGGAYASEFYVSFTGDLSGQTVGGTVGVRPVISISPDAIQYGTGTSTDPFRTTSAI